MSGGRTYWWAKDSAWWRRERIVELLEEFGPTGPAVIDWLSCEAKAQNDGGRVKSGKRSVARGLCVEPVTVGHVLSRSVTLGLLDDFSESDGLFECRISGWSADQNAGQAAARKAREREAKKDENGAVEPNASAHSPGQTVTDRDMSRSVTESGQTGQDRTEVKEQEEARAGIHPQLAEIIAILNEAPGLDLEPLAINAAAMSREGDAVAAARVVASWAHEGGLQHKAANRLLMAAMRNQADEDARRDGVRDIAAGREQRRGTGRKGGGFSASDYLEAGGAA